MVTTVSRAAVLQTISMVVVWMPDTTDQEALQGI